MTAFQRVDVVASHPWYVDHIKPVWLALPAKRRGSFYTDPKKVPASKTPTLVAASGDMFAARRLGRPVAIMEHGAGQSYGGDRRSRSHSSYAGGDGRGAELFLHPGPHPAARDTARYPKARVEVVGCPKLATLPERDHSLDTDSRPVVAVSFHWDCQVAPETRSGFIYFRSGIRPSRQYRLIGHGHPRMFDRLAPWYKRMGIEAVSSFADILRMADLYACDNSSSLFEFAATGRPVVVMNPPFYRRGTNHGLRFWEAADVGLGIAQPSDFDKTVLRALKDPTQARVNREAALDLVYSYRDGSSAERAAEAIMGWVTTR